MLTVNEESQFTWTYALHWSHWTAGLLSKTSFWQIQQGIAALGSGFKYISPDNSKTKIKKRLKLILQLKITILKQEGVIEGFTIGIFCAYSEFLVTCFGSFFMSVSGLHNRSC